MKKTILHLLIYFLLSIHLQAQIPYTDYQNPFPQTYLGFDYPAGNHAIYNSNNLFMFGKIALNPQTQTLLIRKSGLDNSYEYKVYAAYPQTTVHTFVMDDKLMHYYAFISTDATIGCSSAGLKVLKINKNNLTLNDSAFFCDPTKPSAGPGYFYNNYFYVSSAFFQYFPPLPSSYTKKRNLIRRIDTNMVLLNEQLIGDTSVTFGCYFMREAIDTGVILNTINQTLGCPMLIKLDTIGHEVWRRNYHVAYQTGGCSSDTPYGIMGLQSYLNGYIGLLNLGINCTDYLFSKTIIAKLDKQGNLVKEVQYTSAGDTTLEFYSNFTNYTKRTQFYNILVKTNDGNFASVIQDRDRYGINQHENYIVVLDTNLNIIQRSPPLGSFNGFDYPGMAQGTDSTFYLGGTIINSTNDGTNVRIYTWKPGGQVGLMEYGEQLKLKLYPNPVSSELTVESDENLKMVMVYNAMGQMVYQQKQKGEFKINVSTWSKGMYLLELRGEKTVEKQSYKFIVE